MTDILPIVSKAVFLGALVWGCDGGSQQADAGGDASTADAGSDVDNGAPSTSYPAPHPPLPQLVNASKGPVLTSPKVYLVFYPGYAEEAQLQAMAQKMTTSTYWSAVVSEYGVGALSYGGTIDLTSQTPPASITQADLQTWVGSEIQSGAFGTPDPQAIYTIVFPSTTTISQPNPVSALFGTVDSCKAFTGYHDNVGVAVGDGGTTDFAYAVIPTCGPLSTVTSTISHEWVEAATDPQVTSGGTFTLTGGPNAAFYGPDGDHAVWALLGGGEAADLCEPEGSSIDITPTDLAARVQRSWSNAAAAASHDPCVPGISGAFFDSAPVLGETVTFTSAFTGTVTTKGVTIAQGESKTIEVDLFSDGDTGGPWTVSADDVLSTYYGSYGLKPTLSFSWDRTQGQNGEKLHLTITVTGASPVGAAHAFMITSKLSGRVAVWPGLVVE
ncbi:MAG TPA: hypothetical protein VLM85_11350 [Polyangiaceae bacterium]|nr:hypothetical protein [Polyangiaceae bacterium]